MSLWNPYIYKRILWEKFLNLSRQIEEFKNPKYLSACNWEWKFKSQGNFCSVLIAKVRTTKVIDKTFLNPTAKEMERMIMREKSGMSLTACFSVLNFCLETLPILMIGPNLHYLKGELGAKLSNICLFKFNKHCLRRSFSSSTHPTFHFLSHTTTFYTLLIREGGEIQGPFRWSTGIGDGVR